MKVTHFFHTQLPNQLEVIAEMHPYAKTLSLGFFVRSGSRFETSSTAGISHFLEHLVFKGSKTRDAQDVNREFDSMGISFNACTMEEFTVFDAVLLPEFLEPCMEIYSDILRPELRKEDFLAEKEVVLEEIGMYENEPPYCFDDRLRQTFFNGHPLGNPVLGSVKNVRKLKIPQVKAWIQERYAPQNIILCACGKVDFEKLVQLAEKYCGTWKNVTVPQNQLESTSFTPELGVRTFHQSQAVQQCILSTSVVHSPNARQTLTARLIASILGDDAGSRLYWEFVDSGRAEHAVMSFTGYSDEGCFNSSLSCEPETATENIRRLEKIFTDVQNGDISESELALAKNRLITAWILGNEKSRNRLDTVGGDWLVAHEYFSLEEDVNTLRSITLEEIAELLTRFPLTESLTFSVGP